MSELSGVSYIDRVLASEIVSAMAEARVVGLLGARQVGKSTLVRRLAAGPLALDYLTLDNEQTRAAASADPVGFLADLGGPTAIDEIQRVPELLLAIKVVVDRDNAAGQFLITGSANLRRIPTVADALPGRVDYLTLWPFTQAELEGTDGRFLDRLFSCEVPRITDAPVGRAAYLARLLAGGFPEGVRRGDANRVRYFGSYVSSLLERDIVETSPLRDPSIATRAIRLVAARSGSLARFDSIGSDLGINGKTAQSHLEALERLFLVRIRSAWTVNLGKRQIKAPKLYIADSGMLAGLLGANSARLASDPGLAGALFETFAATELERLASAGPDIYTFSHFREGERKVDVVVEDPSGRIVGLEVKAAATVRSRDWSGLAMLRDELGERFVAGAVLYAGERTLRLTDRIWAVPLSGLWNPGQ